MCIGIPMQVIEAGRGRAMASGRGLTETVDTRLVGDCAVGDWLLVLHSAARERLDAARAAEIGAALDLLQAGLAGEAVAGVDPGFALPSAMSAEQVAALTAAAGAPATSAGGTDG